MTLQTARYFSNASAPAIRCEQNWSLCLRQPNTLVGFLIRAGCTWLNKAYDDRDALLVFLQVEPLFDGLRSDARFDQLLRRVGLRQQINEAL